MPTSFDLQRRPSGLILLAALTLPACRDPGAGAASTTASSGSAPLATSAQAASAAPSSSAPFAPTESASATTSASAPLVASAAPSAVASTPPKRIADAGAPASSGAAIGNDAGATATTGDAGVAALSPGAALAKRVDAIYAAKKTFSARFKQEYLLKVSNQTKTSSGTVFIERPNKISFRYDPPNKNRIVSDGVTLKVYIAEDNQMIEKPVEKSQYPGAFGFLMGNGISSSFTFTINDKAAYKDGPVLQGKPTSPTPDYESATFFINKALLDKSDSGAVARVSLVDAQGNKNRFELEGGTQPQVIDPSEFTFTAPPGTNVIH